MTPAGQARAAKSNKLLPEVGQQVRAAGKREKRAGWGVEPHQIYVTDNQPLVRWLNNKRTDSDPEWQGTLEYVEERVRERCADVIWVPTKEQRADRHTKFVRAGPRAP